MLSFDYAARATVGARDYQEDASAFRPLAVGAAEAVSAEAGAGTAAARRRAPWPFPESGSAAGPLLAALADGMGGHVGGSLASRTVCETFLTVYDAVEATSPRERLVTALECANGAIADKVDENPMLSGMGSTLVGVLFDDDGASWVSVGDSPLLLWRRGEIAVLNEDHSLAPELDRMAESGRISFDAARRDPRRHMLRSAVTGEDIEMVDLPSRPLRLEAGDCVILASDGLHTLETSEIARIVTGYAEDGAQAVASALIRAVENLRDPHQDNTTVAVVRVHAS